MMHREVSEKKPANLLFLSSYLLHEFWFSSRYILQFFLLPSEICYRQTG